MMRFVLSVCLVFALSLTAWAEEKITRYDVDIDVQENGGLIVTETLDVIAEGNQIRRGIFREMPRFYEFMGVKLENNYEIIYIRRDDRDENYAVLEDGNAQTWRIGNRDIILEPGPYKYEIKYRLEEQVRRHRGDGTSLGNRDEVYWNAIGAYWNFPIEAANVRVNFPQGAEVIDTNAITGRYGATESAAAHSGRGSQAEFTLTRPLAPREGLTVSASVKPGIIAPMSQARKREISWIRRGGPTLLGLGGLGLFIYYISMWNRVGRDPVKPPVFARYEPPAGYSAAAVHTVNKRGVDRETALTATLMSLSVKNVLDIEAKSKKKTILTSMLANRDSAGLLKDERKLLDLLFGDRDDKITLDSKPNKSFHRDVMSFTGHLMKTYGRDYFRANAGWGLLGMAASLALVGFIMTQPVSRSGPLFLAMLLGIAAMNILFFVLLRAPTKKGAQINSEIDGFKLYLSLAEKDRINTADPAGNKPPAMTVELYERFLPYAMALGVEKPWTKQFEDTLPEVARDYQPSYAHGNHITRGGSPIKMSEALAGAMTAGVAAAAPVSSSSSSGGFSSGSSGGGFSGGGGGGGGGGGW